MTLAMDLAERGYTRLIPVDPTTKRPLIRGWLTEATNDPDTLARWAKRWPNHGVSIVTGWGLVVIDLDVKNGLDGPTEWRTWCAEHNVRLMNRTVKTRSGGVTAALRRRGALLPWDEFVSLRRQRRETVVAQG